MSGPVIVAGVRPALTVEQQLRQEVRELVEALIGLEAMAERYRAPGAPMPDAQKAARAVIAKHKGQAS